MERKLCRKAARPFQPLVDHHRWKFAKGGRSSGKSHFFAEEVVLRAVDDPSLRVLCIREIQKSLKFSAKHLIEAKIHLHGVQDYFKITREEIACTRGSGVIVFAGMQDHTADSIKSFEDFGVAWFEEAQRMSARSSEILIPTIRAPGSELWFSWNPADPEDAIERLHADIMADESADAVSVHVNYTDNPFCPPEAINEAERSRRNNPEKYDHVWLGQYVSNSEARVLQHKLSVREFEPGPDWDGPYHGADWGFAQDPTVAVRMWIHDNRLWFEYESGGPGIETRHIAQRFRSDIPGIEKYEIIGDNARPETISQLQADGLRIRACEKWKGSVEDGVEHLRSYEEIVVHPRCTETARECRLYSYKTDRLSGQVLPSIIDAYNHRIDAARYGLEPIIMKNQFAWGDVGSAR